jgi:hypothetical protein
LPTETPCVINEKIETLLYILQNNNCKRTHNCQTSYHYISPEKHKSCRAAIASFVKFTCASLRC